MAPLDSQGPPKGEVSAAPSVTVTFTLTRKASGGRVAGGVASVAVSDPHRSAVCHNHSRAAPTAPSHPCCVPQVEFGTTLLVCGDWEELGGWELGSGEQQQQQAEVGVRVKFISHT